MKEVGTEQRCTHIEITCYKISALAMTSPNLRFCFRKRAQHRTVFEKLWLLWFLLVLANAKTDTLHGKANILREWYYLQVFP